MPNAGVGCSRCVHGCVFFFVLQVGVVFDWDSLVLLIGYWGVFPSDWLEVRSGGDT